jgi:MOSC domain-containing protein YiiM
MKNNNNNGAVYRISIAPQKGIKKKNVRTAKISIERGIEGDAHGITHRPISLLPFESFVKVQHPDLDINPGDFAENITTVGVDFTKIKIGTMVHIGESVEIKITQIGKKCHHSCIIRETVGDCIMPREGVFGRVLRGGDIREGDLVEVVN